jgi:hypothetical protein
MYEKETLKVKICRHSKIKFGIDYKLMNTPQGFLLHHWNILARATMSSCKPIATPVSSSVKLGTRVGDFFPECTKYRQLVSADYDLHFSC